MALTPNINENILTFSALGDFLSEFSLNYHNYTLDSNKSALKGELMHLVKKINVYNPWFTEEFVLLSLSSISKNLTIEKLTEWLLPYEEYLIKNNPLKRIGVVTAGNIPLAGFHDFMSVLITNHIFIGKLSSKDDKLLPLLSDVLISINPSLKEKIIFENNNLKNFDAVIATGSNNSARYFHSYFKRFPNIIRKNRNSLAILSGNEEPEKLEAFGKDIFSYFGLGCRNVSKIIIPKEYDLEKLFGFFEDYKDLYSHHKYANNYDYNKAIFLMNRTPHLDNGFMLFKEDYGIDPPAAVVYYHRYQSIEEVKQYIKENENKIQCIVSECCPFVSTVPFGKSQEPELWDYADGIDTIKFLLTI